MLERFKLDGKTALVTGCRRGIGKAIAVALAQAGADIAGVSASLETAGSAVEREVEKAGRQFRGYACDFANRDAVYKLIERVKGEVPPIDILVNNAGTIMRSPAAEHPDQDWDRVIGINLNAQFILSREFGRDMVARGSGKIIFIASVLSFQGGIYVPGYAASKGAIASLVKALANEWAGRGVQVNGIAPGYIRTDNNEALRTDAARNAAILARIPAGRWGEAEDLQGAAVYLASSASNYANGTILLVDGGWMGR
ncbi:MAG: SDR family oxidoreductase [Bryobacteraceae bacterium]|nr:SDR family oxidoreductase [Bryobacterales bacterium]MEB2363925.1 SDR family oxidoreductase [Bryobacterales bacterium]NUN00289.1 SDR family oxidoreductase [Bryobacteraceae bacterium]